MVQVLWACPNCRGWNVTAHGVATIQRTWKYGSRRARTQAVCSHDGTTGLPACPGNPDRGFRRPLGPSRGGKPTVNIVRRQAGLPEAAVSAAKPAQVQRLRNVAEAANMALALGEPTSLAERKQMWVREGGEGDQPWRRWVRITEGANERPVSCLWT